MFGHSSSRANSSQSSIARSGSASRTERGVSSCSAAVSTLIFMNFGSKAAVIGTLLVVWRPRRPPVFDPFRAVEEHGARRVDPRTQAISGAKRATPRSHDVHMSPGPVAQQRRARSDVLH